MSKRPATVANGRLILSNTRQRLERQPIRYAKESQDISSYTLDKYGAELYWHLQRSTLVEEQRGGKSLLSQLITVLYSYSYTCNRHARITMTGVLRFARLFSSVFWKLPLPRIPYHWQKK